MTPLASTWFNTDDITNFEPEIRFITGKALIDRWSQIPGIEANALIRAKIEESRLLDMHPMRGLTQGSNPDDEFYPPLELGLFRHSDVTKIELEDCLCIEQSEVGTGDRDQNFSVDSHPHPLAMFRSMENLLFKEIIIRVDPEQLIIRISARGKKTSAPFHVLSITKKNAITPNKQCEVFMALASQSYYPGTKGYKGATSRLSKSLREAFDTADEPFSKGKPQFKIYVPKDRSAKLRALHKTSQPYKNITRARRDKKTQEFLKANDQHYDPDDDLYSDDPDLGVVDDTDVTSS